MRRARIPVIAGLVGVAFLLSGCAAGPLVSAVALAKGEDADGVSVAVTGATQVVVREITLRPGGTTGRHCHAGQLIGIVEQGTLTHYAPVYPGGVHVYHAGDTIVEGADYVHEGKNLGTEDVKLMVTYLIADGQPLAQTDLSHCDAE